MNGQTKRDPKMKFVEVKKACNLGELPFTVNTAYHWHSKGQYPKMIFKVHGKLFFDWDEWHAMAITARDKHVAEAKGETS